MHLAQNPDPPAHAEPCLRELYEAQDEMMMFDYDPLWREKRAQAQTGKVAASTN